MAEETERPVGSGGNDDSAAAALALTSASRTKADAYLDARIEASRLERDNLIEQNAFELSHLRWRRFNDQMKGALQIMAIVIAAVMVIALGAALWNASRADGLVVDVFSVPPQLSASGVSGSVVADDITGKLIAIRNIANKNSLGESKDVQQDGGADIKVEIPDTGISLSEAWRYLRSWLGHERHLRGSLRLANAGTVVLTLNGEDAASFSGAPADLDRLEQKAAEHVSANADAAQFVIYLNVMGRSAEALALSAKIAKAATENRADLYALWANELDVQGDERHALAMAHFAIAIDPRVATPHLEAGGSADHLGHDEEAVQQDSEVLALEDSDQPDYERGRGFAQMRDIAALDRDMKIGDFIRADSDRNDSDSQASQIALRASLAARLHNGAKARKSIAQAELVAGDHDADSLGRARYILDMAAGNWRAAAVEARGLAARANAKAPDAYRANVMLAYALAKDGDIAGARAVIAAAPRDCDDCDDCLTKRGDVEAAAHNWPAAAWWFAKAVQAAPSLPFAYADWGAMLLAKGDTAGAIVQFARAHAKGPHFADPLEMWGEALMLQNRSDLALAKFTDANRFAPNWGRLHLKWGDALTYGGRKDEAAKQFALARTLTLLPSENAELARVSRH
ncbi:MAG TPA: hypothetical protein VGG10_18810 [Rhizomicrobium sp.]|jgi:hypothetical protein